TAWLRMMLSRIRSWMSPQESDREFEQEMASHFEMLMQENVARGMSYEEAQRAARIRLGGSTQLREANRELRGLPFLETLSQDIRYAFRMLRKSPGFTLVAVLTLALGIGANTAIFSVVYAVLLKPLPYEKPEQLFTVFQQQAKDEKMATGWGYLLFDEMRSQNRIFQEMAGVQFHQLTLTGRGQPFLVDTSIVTSKFFSVFEPRPILGPAFLPEEGKPGGPATVVLSENLWRSTFVADPNIVGTSINLDKRSYTVIGVMPAAFRYPQMTESDQIWIPLAQDPLFGPWMSRPGGHWLRVTARLKPGVTMAQARADLDAFGERFAKEYPDQQAGWVVGMAPLQQVMVGDVRPALLVLLGAVGLVLLIACANLANLLLARSTSRAREFALRSTLGAGRGRLIRQLMSETAVLGLLGGATGIALAY